MCILENSYTKNKNRYFNWPKNKKTIKQNKEISEKSQKRFLANNIQWIIFFSNNADILNDKNEELFFWWLLIAREKTNTSK